MSESDAAAEPLTTDRAFDLLGDATRRRAVAILREADGAMALDDLADEILARAPDAMPGDATVGDVTSPNATPGDAFPDRRRRTRASLHHCHLPKLDDADVVEYDRAENRVEVTPVVEDLEPFFEVIEVGVEELRAD